MSLGPLPNRSLKRPSGRPRSKRLDENNVPPGDVPTAKVIPGHSAVQLTTYSDHDNVT